MKSEMLSNRHTQTHRPNTVTLAAHACRGLIIAMCIECATVLRANTTQVMCVTIKLVKVCIAVQTDVLLLPRG